MAVKARDLRLDELFSSSPMGGMLTFAGQRTLLLDAVAMGLLRQQLIGLLGHHGARGVLTRFGYAHGWRTAEAMRHALSWESEREWQIAGGRLHRLQGLVLFEPVDSDECLASAVWRQSYEAEQHLLHLGRSEAPVCWSLTGFASGYLSHVHGRTVYAIERHCVGCGDAICRMEARFEDDWGNEIDEWRQYYEQDCLNDDLESVRTALLEAESDLRVSAQSTHSPSAIARRAGIVARSANMLQLVELAARVGRVDTNVLITGESGTGKERFARFIHNQSGRSAGPFVAINCGAVPETLLESELFGHARGAFTGASEARMGLLEAANGGTLFLDEVGEISAAMQVKLLRVLQERTIRRVGENQDRPVDVRILSASHKDLEAAIGTGEIREDFYFRLRVVELQVPPLRARRDDILPLAQRFLAETLRRLGSPERRLGADAIDWLKAYDWPGNVRELQNAIEHAVVLSTGTKIKPRDLPSHLGVGRVDPSTTDAGRPTAVPTSSGPDLRPLEEIEREHILAVLAAMDGNRSQAAEALGIGPATLYRRLREYRENGTDV